MWIQLNSIRKAGPAGGSSHRLTDNLQIVSTLSMNEFKNKYNRINFTSEII